MNDVRIIAYVLLAIFGILDFLVIKAFSLNYLWFVIPCSILSGVVGLFCLIVTIITKEED